MAQVFLKNKINVLLVPEKAPASIVLLKNEVNALLVLETAREPLEQGFKAEMISPCHEGMPARVNFSHLALPHMQNFLP